MCNGIFTAFRGGFGYLPKSIASPSLGPSAAFVSVLHTLQALPSGAAYFGKGVLREVETKDIFLFSQAIAFKVLVTVVPVLVLATGIIGQVLRRDEPFEVVEGLVRDLLPGGQSEQILMFLRDLQGASSTITILGVIGILVSAVTLLTTLRAVVKSIFAESYRESRTILGGYLFDARMVVQVGLLFLLTITITVSSQWLGGAGIDFIRWYDLDWEWLFQGWSVLFSAVALVLPLFVTMAMFAQLYFFVPRPRPPKRSVARGAFVAAVLWEAAKYAFTFYASHVAGFDLGSTFGLIIAFGFWIYYSGIVFCIGALIALLDEKRMLENRAFVARHDHDSGPPMHPAGAKLPSTPMPVLDDAPDPDEDVVPADVPPSRSTS
jgi:membrane protein